jgi:hypothetical protein
MKAATMTFKRLLFTTVYLLMISFLSTSIKQKI